MTLNSKNFGMYYEPIVASGWFSLFHWNQHARTPDICPKKSVQTCCIFMSNKMKYRFNWTFSNRFIINAIRQINSEKWINPCGFRRKQWRRRHAVMLSKRFFMLLKFGYENLIRFVWIAVTLIMLHHLFNRKIIDFDIFSSTFVHFYSFLFNFLLHSSM